VGVQQILERRASLHEGLPEEPHHGRPVPRVIEEQACEYRLHLVHETRGRIAVIEDVIVVLVQEFIVHHLTDDPVHNWPVDFSGLLDHAVV